ncbi:MAG: TrmH family RNA methyltransferase [Candidatus Latescibacteria bacterium]|nr:TrmH family RNA methyltransferase [Candidatus Latescibacterota bacterium]
MTRWMEAGDRSVERNPIYVIVENVRSLFNVGAIFRTADGVKARKVFLTGFTGTPPRREIEKVALGADRAVPWTYCADTRSVICGLRREGVQILALERTDRSVDFQDYPYSFPVAVVVGHEVAGIADETVSACDASVHIPMCGIKRSLNVSVACGVLLYEVLRRLRSHEPP